MFKNIFPDQNNRLVYNKAKPDAPKGGEVAGASTPPAPKPEPDPQDRGRTAIERAIQRQMTGMTVGDKVDDIVGRILHELNNTSHPLTTRGNTRELMNRLRLPEASGPWALQEIYEKAIVRHAQEKAKTGIEPKVHEACLNQLRTLPFSTIMRWYENSDANGMPLRGQKDALPGQIHLPSIFRAQSPEKRLVRGPMNAFDARYAVRQTIDHFLRMAGGKTALKKRWVTMVEDPNYKPKNGEERDFQNFIKTTGIKPNDVTWEMVLRTETNLAEVASKK